MTADVGWGGARSIGALKPVDKRARLVSNPGHGCIAALTLIPLQSQRILLRDAYRQGGMMRSLLTLCFFAVTLAFQCTNVASAGDALALFSAYKYPDGNKLYITDGTAAGTRAISGIPSRFMVPSIRHKAALPGAAAITTAFPTTSRDYSLYLFNISGVPTRAFVAKYPIDIVGTAENLLYFMAQLEGGKRFLHELDSSTNVIRRLFEIRSDRPENTRILRISDDICVLQSFSIDSSVVVRCLKNPSRSFKRYISYPGIFQEIYAVGDRVIINCNGCESNWTETRPYVIDIRRRMVYPLISSRSDIWDTNLGDINSHVTFNVIGRTAYFIVKEGRGTYLWKTNATQAGTQRVSTSNIEGYEYWRKNKVVNGRIYIPTKKSGPFDGYYEILSTSGVGPFRRHSFRTGSFQVQMYRDEFELIGNQIYFVGKAPVQNPRSLDTAIYRADVTNGNAVMLVNYNKEFEYDDVTGILAAYDEGAQFTRVQNRVIFMLGDGIYYGIGLGPDFFPWISNGQPAGTFMLKDADLTWDGYQLQEFAPLGPVQK